MVIMKKNKTLLVAAAFSISLTLLSGCAATKDASKGAHGASSISDPLEPFNRAMFGFNNILDRVLIEPVAKAYTFVTPAFVRNAVQSFMRNLNEPIVFANNLLQADFGGAGVSASRFFVNTTAGVLGLVDVAAVHGLPYEEEDFGQTLAVWGFGEGFYLVLPLMGPSSARDAVGLAVDTLADPVRLATHDPNDEWIYYTRNAIEGIDNRSRLLGAVEDLRRNSFDYYATVRSAYVQRRQGLIHGQAKATGHNAYDEFETQ
jgi:phospholipid-binding lipoprotein MlaA